MLSKKIEQALNDQIKIEAESSQVYLAMASWAETQGFEGVASFMYAHSDEERMHMLKLAKFVNERGAHAKVSALAAPPAHKPIANIKFQIQKRTQALLIIFFI